MVSPGDDQAFTIVPDAGYHTDSLIVDGLFVDSTTGYTFYNVNENHTIEASFAIDTFFVTATAGPGGTILV